MINNKKIMVGLAFFTLALVGCSTDDDDNGERGNWKERSVFNGIPRSNAISFTIGNKGYMGTGYDGDDYLSDFWEYDIDGDFWAQKASFPGTPRSSASSFTLNSNGYLGVGYDGDNELSDFWEYKTSSNSWNQKADFGAGVRRGAVGFGINNTGYIGTGYDGDNDKKDFWKYNPTTDEWHELIGFGGHKRRDATTFIINDKVYLCTGVSNGLYVDDFWEFDPQTEIWTRKRDLTYEDDYYIRRSNAVGFSINGLGYITAGYTGGAIGTIWEYIPEADTWEEITALEATVRQDPVSFSNGNRAFVLLGRTGSLYLDDNYEIFPFEEYDDED